jgi:hypothetical protein
MMSLHRNDPPRLAAVYYSGDLRRSRGNAWHAAAACGYIDRFVQAYNAYRDWERAGEPSTSP